MNRDLCSQGNTPTIGAQPAVAQAQYGNVENNKASYKLRRGHYVKSKLVQA